MINYLQSFPADDGNPDNVTVSLSQLEKWYEKFSMKLKMDPYFVFKTSQN